MRQGLDCGQRPKGVDWLAGGDSMLTGCKGVVPPFALASAADLAFACSCSGTPPAFARALLPDEDDGGGDA